MEKIGRVETVLLRGETVVENGSYVGHAGQGQLLRRKPFALMYQG